MQRNIADLPIFEHEMLARYTTLGVGGPARFLIVASSEDEVLDALSFARARSCPVFILGGGSNIVVSDAGFPGLVIKIEIRGIHSLDGAPDAALSAGAGVVWDAFVQHCVQRNLAGVECLSGIPGTVGATPVQNVGAYGEEVSEVISEIRVLDRDSHSITELRREDCGFSYRSSIFNTTHQNRYVILRVDFALSPGAKPSIHYEDLRRCFAGTEPAINEVRDAVLQIRKNKGMLLLKDDPDSKSVGSFFKNPILTPAAVVRLEEDARSRGFLGASECIPRFAEPGGKEKLPAAWLVERTGFQRGYSSGRAGISSKHALALVNRGGATAKDILDLMDTIKSRVLKFFGVELQPEPVFLGFDEIR